MSITLPRNGSSGRLSRDEAGLILYQGRTPAPEPCGAATIFTTERIVIEDVSHRGSASIWIDVSNGRFSNGGQDIPIRIDLGPSGFDGFLIEGGRGDDFWTFGTRRGNLQRDSRAEISFLNPPEIGWAWAAGGRNRVSAGGGQGTGRPSPIYWAIGAGSGDDRLTGGRNEDEIHGEGGDDRLGSGADQEVLVGERGEDVLAGNRGGDHLDGGEGRPNARQKGSRFAPGGGATT